MSPNAYLHKSLAPLAKSRMQGTVKDREEAKKEYLTAVSEDRNAAYGEVSSESRDIMKIPIGNLPPKENVVIEIAFVYELDIVLNTFYAFNFLPKLNPRYMSSIPK
jgi:hypothetical protein